LFVYIVVLVTRQLVGILLRLFGFIPF